MSEALTQLEAATLLTLDITELGPHPHEKEIFDAIYHFLDYYDQHAYPVMFGDDPRSDELDEEEVVELRPTAADFDLDAEFHTYSQTVGTFEGTNELAEIVGKETAKRDGVVDFLINKGFTPQAAEGFIKMTYNNAGNQQGFNTGKTLDEAFGPCGAD